jgi:hypothetical protein
MTSAGKRQSKRAKRATKKADEAKVQAMEQALVDGSAAPASADDFDRLLLGSPNNSYIWVQYAAFYLQVFHRRRFCYFNRFFCLAAHCFFAMVH